MNDFQWDTAAAVGTAGLVLAAIQLVLGRQHQRIESTFRLVEQLQSERARQARFRVREINRRAEALGWDFDRLESAEREQLASVGSVFGFAGALCRARRIDERMFLDFWASSITDNYGKLARYRAWRLARFSDHLGTSWAHFEWLSVRAERHLKALRRRSRTQTV